MLLLKALYAIEASGNTPLYSDTDSIYIGLQDKDALYKALGRIDLGEQLVTDIHSCYDKGLFLSSTVLGGLKDET